MEGWIGGKKMFNIKFAKLSFSDDGINFYKKVASVVICDAFKIYELETFGH